MKILLIGNTGTIGKAVYNDLHKEFNVIGVTRNSSTIKVDIKNEQSIEYMYQQVGKFDALVSTLGGVVFDSLDNLTSKSFIESFNDKLIGQINLVLIGKKYINAGGSFTLTSGITYRSFIKDGICATTVNNALNGFVKASAVELVKEKIRINIISPTILEESYDSYYPYFSGFYPVNSKKVAFAYRRSITGVETGLVIDVN